FVQDATGISQPRPPNMTRIVELNRGPFLGAPPELRPLQRFDDATVLDVRPAEAFAAGHVHGAFNISAAASSFATRAGFLLSPEERIAIHASSPAELELAARRLRS